MVPQVPQVCLRPGPGPVSSESFVFFVLGFFWSPLAFWLPRLPRPAYGQALALLSGPWPFPPGLGPVSLKIFGSLFYLASTSSHRPQQEALIIKLCVSAFFFVRFICSLTKRLCSMGGEQTFIRITDDAFTTIDPPSVIVSNVYKSTPLYQ